jgi:hypothetical protein
MDDAYVRLMLSHASLYQRLAADRFKLEAKRRARGQPVRSSAPLYYQGARSCLFQAIDEMQGREPQEVFVKGHYADV